MTKFIAFLLLGLMVIIHARLATAVRNDSLSQTIVIDIFSPFPDQIVHNSINIRTEIDSSFELESVVATIGDLTIPLDPMRPGEFGKVVSTNGFEHGENLLIVTATDIMGDEVQDSVTFIKDIIPQITIESPMQDELVGTEIHFRISCQDDGPDGCQLTVLNGGEVLATGVNLIDTVVPFDWSNASQVDLEVRADDSRLKAIEVLKLYVETSQRVDHVETVDGVIVDVDSERILYIVESIAYRDILKIRHRETGVETDITTLADELNVYTFDAYLSPNGAIFEGRTEDSSHINSIYEWQNGTLTNLRQTTDSLYDLKVAGPYATYKSDQGQLYRRDLENQMTEMIATGLPTSSPRGQHDVADNGVVIFDQGDELFLYSNGATTQVTDDPAHVARWIPLTDGTQFVSTKYDSAQQTYSTALNENGTEIILSEHPSLQNRQYVIEDGWVAYQKLGFSGYNQVWLRSPTTGEQSQITFAGDSSSYVDSLGSNGTLIYATHGNLYQHIPDSDDLFIGFERFDFILPRTKWVDGEAYRFFEGNLMQLKPFVPDLALSGSSSAQSVPVGEPITYTLSASNLSPFDAANVFVAATLPPNSYSISATAESGDCTIDETEVVCTFDSLAAGASADLEVVIVSNQQELTTMTFQVSSEDGDFDLTNGTVTFTTKMLPKLFLPLIVASAN